MKKSITKNPIRNLFRILVCAFILLGFTATNASAQTTVTITCTGSAGSFNSGGVNAAGTKVDGDMTIINTGGAAPSNRGWAHFNLTSIPSGATVTAVTANFYTYSSATSSATNNVYGFTGTPSAILGATLYTNCGSGTSFNAGSWSATGNQAKVLNATGIAFIQANINANTANLGYVRGSSNTYNIAGYPGVSATAPSLTITYTGGAPCSGTPAPGNTISSASPVCAGVAFTLSLQNSTSGSGVTYQWQSSTGSYANIAGATSASYVVSSQSVATSYRCLVTCSGNTGTSTPVSVTMNTLANCYCASAFTNVTYEFLTNVNFGGINNTTTGTIGGPVNYTAQNASVTAGSAYTLSVTIDPDALDYVFAFIDWNQNGTLNDAGEVYTLASSVSTPGPYTQSITVPGGATVGATRMRVMCIYNNAVPDPCVSATYGEAEDYTVTVATPAPCVGTPAPGNTNTTGTSVCSGGSVTLSLQNATAGVGVTYQWYDGASPIGGATLATYTTPALTISHTYYCAVTCSAGPATGNSTATTITVSATPVGGTATGPATGLTGNALSYNVTGTTGNLQWQVSTTAAAGPYTDIVGATTAAASLTASGGGTYYIRCKAYGSGCTDAFSNVITTVVTIANDLPCNALALAIGTNGPYSNSGATADAGEAVPTATASCNVQNAWCENAAQNSLWFTFVGPASGKVTVQAPGFDDQLAVYSATTCGNYTTYTLLAANDDGGAGINGGVAYSALITTLCVTPGVTYYVQLDGYTGTVGTTTILLASVANTPPVITGCPSNISVGNTAGLCTGTATWTAPTAADADACGALTFTSNYAPGATFPAGATTVTYTANDGVNVVTCGFTVTVNDVEAPIINGNNATANTSDDATGDCTFTSGSVGPNVGSYTITSDNCSSSFSVTETFNWNGNPDGTATWTLGTGTWFPVHTYQKGVTTVTVTVTDAAGNTATTSYTQTVIDNEAPTLASFSGTNADTEDGTADCQLNNTGQANGIFTFSDNCSTSLDVDVTYSINGGAPVSNTYTAIPSGSYYSIGMNFPVGVTTTIIVVHDAGGNTSTTTYTQTVTDDVLPTIVPPADVTVCDGAAINLGTATTGDNCGVSTTTNDAPGSFPVGTTVVTWTVTDINGNSATATQNVTVNALPDATIVASNGFHIDCNNPVEVLYPTDMSYSCLWIVDGSFWGTFPSGIAAPISGTWGLTVTDANGCTASSTSTITEDFVAPDATITAAPGLTFCQGQSTVLSVPVTGSTSQVWNQNGVFFATASNPLVTVGATYDVTVTDAINGCTASSSVTTIVNALPIGSAADIVICNGDPSNLALNSDITGTTFTWTSSVTAGGVIGNGACPSGCTSTISDVLTNTGFVHGVVTYTVTPTSPDGCVGADFTPTVTVGAAPATPVISGPSVVCNMTTATYSVVPVPEATLYTWTVPTGVTGMTITSGQGTPTITVSITAGTVIGNVTCQTSNNCLPSNAAASMAVTKKPAQPGLISGPTSTCGQTSASYSIGSVFGATSYAWLVPAGMTIVSGQGSTSINVTMTTAFVYGQVKVSAVNNCGNVPAQALNVTGNVPGTPVTVSGPSNVCGLSTATYSIAPVAGATGYNWTITGAGTIVGSNTGTSVTVALNGTTGGSISAAATNVCGNGTARTLNLSVAAIQPGLISGPTTLCGVNTATYTVASVGTGYTYNWSLAVGSGWSITAGQGTNSITISGTSVTTNPLTGSVKVTSANSCGMTSAYRTLAVTYCHDGIAMNNTESNSNTFSNIYPNPTSSEFTIDVISTSSTTENQEVTVEVYDVLGNLVIHAKHQLVSGTNTMKTNIEDFKNGMYFVRLLDVNSNVIHSQTVIKQ